MQHLNKRLTLNKWHFSWFTNVLHAKFLFFSYFSNFAAAILEHQLLVRQIDARTILNIHLKIVIYFYLGSLAVHTVNIFGWCAWIVSNTRVALQRLAVVGHDVCVTCTSISIPTFSSLVIYCNKVVQTALHEMRFYNRVTPHSYIEIKSIFANMS